MARPVPPESDDLIAYGDDRMIALLTMAVGEMFDLDHLAADRAVEHRYEGLLAAAPLNKMGGSGSTASALAVK